jgi:cyclopropane fatty-acyl-phospholipid synthase-like methyltransferase
LLETLAKQFRKPDGILGRIAGLVMFFENRKINRWTIDRLAIQPGDYILEIGFGPGYAIEEMFQQHQNLKVDGIDLSETMLAAAYARNKKAAQRGRLKLYQGTIEEFHQQLYRYDKVISVNNYPLWKNKKKSLIRIHQLMKEGGKIAITVQPREEDASREKRCPMRSRLNRIYFMPAFGIFR